MMNLKKGFAVLAFALAFAFLPTQVSAAPMCTMSGNMSTLAGSPACQINLFSGSVILDQVTFQSSGNPLANTPPPTAISYILSVVGDTLSFALGGPLGVTGASASMDATVGYHMQGVGVAMKTDTLSSNPLAIGPTAYVNVTATICGGHPLAGCSSADTYQISNNSSPLSTSETAVFNKLYGDVYILKDALVNVGAGGISAALSSWKDTSEFVAVPEPNTTAMLLAGISLIALGTFRKRRHRVQ